MKDVIEFKKLFNEAQDDESSNCNYEQCKKCKGKCCKSMGCHISPSDIKGEINKETIQKLLDTGYVSIDWWEGDVVPIDKEEYGRVYFLRVRNVGSNVIDPSYRGTCILYDDEKGCPLEYKYRPKGARLLRPNSSQIGNCMDCSYSKEDCAIEWRPYYNLLDEFYSELVGPDDYVEGGLEMLFRTLLGI